MYCVNGCHKIIFYPIFINKKKGMIPSSHLPNGQFSDFFNLNPKLIKSSSKSQFSILIFVDRFNSNEY